jgi:hypothetical protein
MGPGQQQQQQQQWAAVVERGWWPRHSSRRCCCRNCCAAGRVFVPAVECKQLDRKQQAKKRHFRIRKKVRLSRAWG